MSARNVNIEFFMYHLLLKKLKCLIHSLTNTNCDRYISQFFNVEFNLKTDFFFCMRKKKLKKKEKMNTRVKNHKVIKFVITCLYCHFSLL